MAHKGNERAPGEIHLVLDDVRWAAIKHLARDTRSTPEMILLEALDQHLSRWALFHEWFTEMCSEMRSREES